ncbi:AAA family ATPase, partial [Candidatus Pyrohabitans sp.]
MIVEKLSLRDFRSHGATKVRFNEGITVIVGENGSGKTTLLDAINFALFKNSSVGVDDLIRRGAEEAQVGLVFYEGGRRYRVVRRRRKGRTAGSSLYRFENGDELLIAKGEGEVTREIERILGINAELFTSAIYIRQGEIDALLSAQPSVRKRIIGKLLGAEDMERAYAAMLEVVREFEMRLAALEGVDADLRSARDRLEGRAEEIRRLEHQLEEWRRARGEVKEAMMVAKGKLAELEEGLRLVRSREALAVERVHLLEKLERLKHYSARLEAVRERGERYLALEAELNRLRKKMENLSVLDALLKGKEREKGEAEAKLAEVEVYLEKALKLASKVLAVPALSLEELVEMLGRRLEEMKETRENINRERDALAKEAANLRGRAGEVEKSLQELLAAGSRCPVCDSNLSEERRERLGKEYRRRIAEALRRAQVLEGELEDKKLELGYVEKKLEEANALKAELSVIRSRAGERDRLRKKIKELEGELKALEEQRRLLEPVAGQVEELEKERDSLKEAHEEYIEARGYLRKHMHEMDELEKRAREVEEELKNIDGSLKKLEEKLGHEISEEHLAGVRIRYEEVQAKFTELEKQISAGEEALRRVKGEIQELEGEINTMEEKLLEKERLEKFISLLRKIRGLFHRDSLQTELRRRALPLIEEYAREVFEEFNLPYSELSLDEDFSVGVFGPLGEESAHMLSGGERVALALALRLGIAKALSGSAMEMIMLDEPTIHLDAQRRQELVEIIKKLSSIPQTIVVT